jgi:hypothetical protein
VNYVEKPAGNGIVVPFTISKSGVKGTVTGVVWRLDPTTRTFSLRITNGTLSTTYAGGQIDVTGVMMTLQSVNTQNNTVVAQPLVNIPFELVDDDAATHPFNVDTSLMQDSDSASQNLFAPAYIKPVYDLGSGSRQAGFNRNVEDDLNEIQDQLAGGREKASTNEYWVAYIQGAFQGPTVPTPDRSADADPNIEGGIGGATPTYDVNPPSDLRQGSLIFVETIRDRKAVLTAAGLCLGINSLAQSVVHEVGHQFGLDEDGGIMTPGGCVPLADQQFLMAHLSAIRGRSHP